MRYLTRLCVMSAILAGTLAGQARADVIYTYTGNNFDTAAGSYTTSDHLSAVLDFSVALGPNFSYQQVLPNSFTLTGGLVGDTVTNSGVSAGIFATTDESGNIDGWYIGAGSNTDPSIYVQTQYTLYDGSQFDYFSNSNGYAFVSNAGQWVTSVSDVPEPSSLLMVIAGLIGLCAVMRRWKATARHDVAQLT